MTIIKNTALITLILTTSGCSIYSAINAPDPVNYKNIHLGENRVNVISTLGQPKASETKKIQIRIILNLLMVIAVDTKLGFYHI